MSGKLRQKDVKILLSLANEEIADFDCGQICASKNRNRIPYCCDIDKAIPVLYRAELQYFQKHSDLWQEFKPRTKDEKKMAAELDQDQVLARCKGPAHCERRYRGFVCRNFPTYPYFDADGNVTGLFFSRVLAGKCVLIDHPELIRKEYIHSQIAFWEYLCERMPADKEFYIKYAITCEKRRKSRGLEFHIIR